MITTFVEKYNLKDFVVVANSGMMSEANVLDLKGKGYRYIIGARIRNMTEETREWILSQEKRLDSVRELVVDKDRHKRLLMDYSGERDAMDARNREKGVEKLRKKYESPSWRYARYSSSTRTGSSSTSAAASSH